MRCYYHEERYAVATCKECNKFLCKNCFEISNNGLCSDCCNSVKNEEKIEKIQFSNDLEELKASKYFYYKKRIIWFLSIFLIGFISGFFIFPMNNNEFTKSVNLYQYFKLYLQLGYVFASFYVGPAILKFLISFFSKIFSSENDNVIITMSSSEYLTKKMIRLVFIPLIGAQLGMVFSIPYISIVIFKFLRLKQRSKAL